MLQYKLGLKKLIIILGAGSTTCAGYPASLGMEQIDAEAFADWGIDCMYQCHPNQPTWVLTIQISDRTTAAFRRIGQTSTTSVSPPFTAEIIPTALALVLPTQPPQATIGRTLILLTVIAACVMPYSASIGQSFIPYANGATPV